MTAPWGWKDVRRTVTESVGIGKNRLQYVTTQVPKDSGSSKSVRAFSKRSSRRRRRKRGVAAAFGPGSGGNS